MKLTHSGTVVYQRKNDQLYFLVISSSSGQHWVLPKGHIEPLETPQDAALRELQEEAGVIGEIVAPLNIQRYIKKGKDVTIQYFLVQKKQLTQALENRTLRWEEASEARLLLSFEEALNALDDAIQMLHDKRAL